MDYPPAVLRYSGANLCWQPAVYAPTWRITATRRCTCRLAAQTVCLIVAYALPSRSSIVAPPCIMWSVGMSSPRRNTHPVGVFAEPFSHGSCGGWQRAHVAARHGRHPEVLPGVRGEPGMHEQPHLRRRSDGVSVLFIRCAGMMTPRWHCNETVRKIRRALPFFCQNWIGGCASSTPTVRASNVNGDT